METYTRIHDEETAANGHIENIKKRGGVASIEKLNGKYLVKYSFPLSSKEHLFRIAEARVKSDFKNGDGSQFKSLKSDFKLNGNKFIKTGLTKSQIKSNLKKLSKSALESIAELNAADWSELAKIELSKSYGA